jgi:hypothetical protein
VELVANTASGVVDTVLDDAAQGQCELAKLDVRADQVLAVMENWIGVARKARGSSMATPTSWLGRRGRRESRAGNPMPGLALRVLGTESLLGVVDQ